MGVLMALSSAGCATRRALPPEALVHLVGAPSVSGYRLTIVPAPGARINARLPPVLELESGERVQFDEAQLTPDSSYFAAPPEATLERGWDHLKEEAR